MKKHFFVCAIGLFISLPVSGNEIKSQKIRHSDTYFLYKKRTMPHIHIVVTPPEKAGEKDKILVEVYNRGKVHISLVKFEIILHNNAALELSSEVEADDLRPGFSGIRKLQVPKNFGKFPSIDNATARNIRIYDENGKELKYKAFLDLIKN